MGSWEELKLSCQSLDFILQVQGQKSQQMPACHVGHSWPGNLFTLVTIVEHAYRQSPEHLAVKCFWICHMGRKESGQCHRLQEQIIIYSYMFSAPW